MSSKLSLVSVLLAVLIGLAVSQQFGNLGTQKRTNGIDRQNGRPNEQNRQLGMGGGQFGGIRRPGMGNGIAFNQRPGGRPGGRPGFSPGIRPGVGSGIRPGLRPGFRPGFRPSLRPGFRPGFGMGMQPLCPCLMASTTPAAPSTNPCSASVIQSSTDPSLIQETTTSSISSLESSTTSSSSDLSIDTTTVSPDSESATIALDYYDYYDYLY